MKPQACTRCKILYSLGIKDHEWGGRRGQHRDYGRHPLLLHCGHTFCRNCLRKFETAEDSVQCPTCQKVTRQGPKGHSLDIYTVGLMCTHRLELEHQSDKILPHHPAKVKTIPAAYRDVGKRLSDPCCAECRQPASCLCPRCDSVMCSACFDSVHSKLASLKKHQALPLPVQPPQDLPQEERGAVVVAHREARSQFCSSHPQHQIEYFCNQDQLPICSRCVIVGNHKGHDVETMEDKNRESLSQMEPAMLEAQETLWRLDKAEQVIKKAMPHNRVDSSKVVEQVRLHFQELHSLLQAREEQLMELIREAAINRTKPFHDMLDFLQNEKTQLNKVLTEAAQVMHALMHTRVDADLILDRLRKAKDVPCMVTVDKDALALPIIFSSDTTLIDAIGSHGNISKASQMFSLAVAGPDAPKPAPHELPAVRLLPSVSESNDSHSVADSASVIAEEEREESGSMASDVTPEQLKVEKPGTIPSGIHLKAGREERIQVTHIRTPGQFCVQLMSTRGELETMQRHINNHCHSLALHGKRETLPSLEPGMVVLAQYSHDKHWYRAKITSIRENVQADQDKEGDTVEVLFLDYGNTENVSCSKLLPMKPKFESYSAFAYRCHLHDLLPVNKAQGWTKESVNVMLNMTSSGPIRMKVFGKEMESLSVDLIKPETLRECVDNQPVSLREMLILRHLAIPATISPQHYPAGRAKCDYISLARPHDGEVLNVAITHVETPSQFFVQGCQPSEVLYIEQQSRAMQDTYEGERGQRYTIFCPREGQMCVAKFDKDGRWYRARVTGLLEGDKVRIRFVDYGNSETVGYCNIRKMVHDYIKFPEQAIECSLVDVEPTDSGQWSEEALQWFKMTTELQYAQLRVVGQCDRPNKVSGVLYLVSQENQLCCVNVEMVQLRLANSTGTWSQRPYFEGITIGLEAMMSSPPSSDAEPSLHKTSLLSPASPVSIQTTRTQLQSPSPQDTKPRSTNTKPHSKDTKPHPQATRICSVQRKGAHEKGGTTTRQPTRKSITLRNLHRGEGQREEGESAAAEAAAMMKSVGVEVVIAEYCSPAHFFIQLQEKQKELLNLMTDLAAYETTAASDHAWTVGECCVAKYRKDNSWYRAKITAIRPDTDTYEVSLIDYGYVDVVPASRIRLLQKEHAGKECFAQRCHLVNLAPAGSMDRSRWSSTAIDFMADEIRAKRLFLKLEGDRMEDMGLPVDILVEELIPETALEPLRHKYISLVKRLQEKGLAFPANRHSTHGRPESPSSRQPAAQEPESLARLEPFLSSRAASGADSTVAADSDITLGVVEGEEEEEVKVVVQPDWDVFPHPPPAYSTLKVIPVCVDSQGIIYVHDRQTEEECTALMNAVDLYARTQAPQGQLEVKAGQVCVAFYPQDQAWYRARVLEVSQYIAKVKYIDYGNTNRLDRNLLRMIPSDLCKQHQMAYEFTLHNLIPNTVDGNWPSAFIEYMEKQLVNNYCTAVIKGDRSQVPVEVDLVLEGGVSMITTLLQTGVVNRKNDMADFFERTADITNILQHSNPYFPLRPGDARSVFTGLVTHIEMPNLVYIQRCEDSNKQVIEELVQFTKLMDSLNDESVAQHAPLQELPAAGEVCCACYSQDQRWYRALVAKTFSYNNTALVFYVDYGNAEVVTLDRLHNLPSHLQDMPAQVLRAYLNIDLPPGVPSWTLPVYRAMGAATYLIKHLVFVKFADPLTVDLYNEEQSNLGTPVLSYQHLINSGMVVIPPPLMVTDMEDGDVIVESYTEEEVDQGSEKESQLAQETDSEPKHKQELEPKLEKEREPEKDTKPELENDIEPELENDTEPELEKDTKPELENVKESELEKEQEPEKEPVLPQEPEPKQNKETEVEEEKETELKQENYWQQEEKREQIKEEQNKELSTDSELD